MLDWYKTSFAADPAGWIAIWVVAGTAVLSGVFWRRTWTALKAIGRVARWGLGALFSLRLTTVSRLRPKKTAFVPPARWDVTRFKDAPANEYALANFGEGSVARDVKLDVSGDRVRLRSAAAWPSIDGGLSGKFLMVADDMSFFGGGPWFTIEWTDAHGRRRSEALQVG